MADSIDDTSGNIVCCADVYDGVMTVLRSCAVYCMKCLSIQLYIRIYVHTKHAAIGRVKAYKIN